MILNLRTSKSDFSKTAVFRSQKNLPETSLYTKETQENKTKRPRPSWHRLKTEVKKQKEIGEDGKVGEGTQKCVDGEGQRYFGRSPIPKTNEGQIV